MSNSAPSTPLESACQLVSFQRSLLDALFVTKDRRAPRFATITNGLVTSLYQVEPSGDLQIVAQIQWEAHGPQNHSLTFRGNTMQSQKLLVRSKTFLGEASWTLHYEGAKYRWKLEGCGDDALISSYMILRSWACYECSVPTTSPSASTTSSSSSSSSLSTVSTPVATLLPPQVGAVASAGAELNIHDRARHLGDVLLASAIVLSATRSQWRAANSRHTHETLERILRAEATGALPPYLPAPAPTPRAFGMAIPRRATRRPHTAHGTGPRLLLARGAFGTVDLGNAGSGASGEEGVPEPPPYASREDLYRYQNS